MRILIVGAGIAGLTLAALLKQRGLSPIIIERQKDFSHVGYMLGLFPLASKILYGLNLHEAYLDISVPLNTYDMCTGDGNLIRSYPMQKILEQYGPYRCLTRQQLLSLLHAYLENTLPIKMDTTIQSLTQSNNDVQVILNDGSTLTVDLVVGADGMHSQVRKFICTENNVKTFDTGWGGWVWWADKAIIPQDTIIEHLGTNNFLGLYPTKEKVGVVAAAPCIKEKTHTYSGRANDIRQQFASLVDKYPLVFNELPNDQDNNMFYWPLNDVRAKSWIKGRVALIGDAATGFLPTAGIGASMAMESAAVLNDELSRTDAQYLPIALQYYVKRRQKRAESLQSDSRKLANYLFIKSALGAKIRNYFLKYYSIEMLAKSISKSFLDPI